MDEFDLLVVLVAIGFGVLAFMLLYPVYRFLVREEQHSKRWTRDYLESVPDEKGDTAPAGRNGKTSSPGRGTGP
jgi:hypothetical protein